jgi:hypothetical protein
MSYMFTANLFYVVRFQVLTAGSMNMTNVWDIKPCSLTEVDRRFRNFYNLHHQGDRPVISHTYLAARGICFCVM